MYLKKSKNNYLKMIKILILIMFFFIIQNCQIINNKKEPKAINGVMDLSNWDFNNNKAIRLKGEWEFYWSKILNPDDFYKIDTKKCEYVLLPKAWNNYKVNNKRVGYKGYATYRLKIININNSQEYSLKIPEMPSAYNLFINGEKIASNGKVSTNKKTMIPQYLPLVIDYQLKEKDLDIILQISNFHEHLGGAWKSILFGSKKDIHWMFRINISLEFFLFGILLIMCVYHLSLFILRRKDIVVFYFGIFCLIIAVRLLVSGERFVNHLFPNLNWETTRKLFALTFFTSVPIFLMFIHELFPKEFSKLIIKIAQVICIFLCFITFFTSANIYTKAVVIYDGITVIYSLYSIYVMILAIINKREGSLISIIGFVIFFLTIINDILYTESIIQTGFYVPFGLFVFIFFQAFLLSMRFSKAFNKIENLSYKLEKTNKQLKDININLEQKVLNRTKQLEEAHEQKTNIFINIAHETKTPLTLISNYLDKYIKKHKETGDLLIIKNNIDKLKKDMINFLDIQKLERGQIYYNHNQIINLSNILKEKIKLFTIITWRKRIHIISDNIENNIVIKIDPYAIDRILNNLIDNAIKYNKEFGKIEISLTEIYNKIILMIKDTGIGISKEQQETIFNPYYQISHKKRNIQGIGMGLNIVKNIINDVNGKIEINSELNKGTVFIITFNKHIINKNDKITNNIELSSPFNSIVNIKLKEEKYDNKRKNILLVEDNIEMLSYLQESFYDEYNVFMSKNGVDALKKINEMPKPNIIISDIMMDKMNGYEFYDELIKNDKYNYIPFIFLTALTSNNEKIKSLKKGAVDYIYKPFTIEELKHKVTSILRIQENQKISNMKKINHQLLKILYEESNIFKEKDININKICIDYSITKREKDIIKQLLTGLGYKDIALKLSISYNSVKKSIENIYKKLKVNNKIELVNKFNSLNN